MSFKEVKSLFEDELHFFYTDYGDAAIGIEPVYFYGLKGECTFSFEDYKLVEFEFEPEWQYYENLLETNSESQLLGDMPEAIEYIVNRSRKEMEKALKDKSEKFTKEPEEGYEMVIYDKIITGNIESDRFTPFTVLISKKDKVETVSSNTDSPEELPPVEYIVATLEDEFIVFDDKKVKFDMSPKEVRALFEDDISDYHEFRDGYTIIEIEPVYFYGFKGSCNFIFKDQKLVGFEFKPIWGYYEILFERDSDGELVRNMFEGIEYVAKLSREGIEKALKDKSDKYTREDKEDYELVIYDKIITGNLVEERDLIHFNLEISKRDKNL